MGSVGTRQYLLNSRRREIVKIMADIDKMDNLLLQYWDNLQTKRCFLERNNKVDKSLMRLRKTLMLHIYKNISGNSDIENFISFINEWFFILLGFSVLRQVISVWVWLRCWPCVCGKKGGSGSWISRPWVFPPNRIVQSKKHCREAASKWGARSARNASNFVGSVLMAGGNGNPPQDSCLENAMDRRAWWATVHGIEKSWTCLSTRTVDGRQHSSQNVVTIKKLQQTPLL